MFPPHEGEQRIAVRRVCAANDSSRAPLSHTRGEPGQADDEVARHRNEFERRIPGKSGPRRREESGADRVFKQRAQEFSCADAVLPVVTLQGLCPRKRRLRRGREQSWERRDRNTRSPRQTCRTLRLQPDRCEVELAVQVEFIQHATAQQVRAEHDIWRLHCLPTYRQRRPRRLDDAKRPPAEAHAAAPLPPCSTRIRAASAAGPLRNDR